MKKIYLIISIIVSMQFAFGQNPNWTVDPANFAFNGEVVGKVFMNSVAVETGTMATFVGSECRGVADATFFPPGGHYVFVLLCYSNIANGETLSFKYYDPGTNQVFDLVETVPFVPDMIVGNAMNPMIFNALVSYLTLDPTNENVSSSPGNYTVDLSSNVTWTISESCDWVTCTPMSGNNNGSFTVTYSENTSINSRSCDITVSNGDISEIHTINQEGAISCELTVSPENYDFGDVLLTECSDQVIFILSNNGSEPASGFINLNGPNYNQFNLVSGGGFFEIEPGGEYPVVVEFCPTQTGSMNVNLVVNADDPCNDIVV
nr:hypothetical protein [Bacteroidota bacterium]